MTWHFSLVQEDTAIFYTASVVILGRQSWMLCCVLPVKKSLTCFKSEVGEIDWYWRYCQYYWQYSWNWILKSTSKWSWVWNWILKSQHLAFDIKFKSWLVKFQCWVLNLDIVKHFMRYWTWIWYWENNFEVLMLNIDIE